ncbi:hypothetical protein [Arenimonas daejeonensis]|uniref:hypothetical protein n=1 Tax=Arenimonas daejeonensis TaxID=370777 RepID=UPI0011BEFC5C|nr:hypothetical protein [Arenimonas daejeonensis]
MRRIASFCFPVLLVLPLAAAANNGQEGTFEFAIDAPWRIEPVLDINGRASYGAIPLSIVVTDENAIPFDAPLEDPFKYKIGNFCELQVFHADGNWRKTIAFNELTEVEHTGNSTTTWINGTWRPAGPGIVQPPPHEICKPATGICEASRTPHGSSEWYATAWYTPTRDDSFVPGADLPLTLKAVFTTRPEIGCESEHDADFLWLVNHVSVHAGEAPLPRFDQRWAYGDLHYHGQGTDNEGEEGYGYRGTLKAMGAMGLDFVFATEHASDSRQIVDVDYTGVASVIFGGIEGAFPNFPHVLRDMNSARFRFLHNELWRDQGANRESATKSSTGEVPQNIRGRGVAPQIFLGGEVDVIPELPADYDRNTFPIADGGDYDHYYLPNLCGGWNHPITSCDVTRIHEQRNGAMILKDVQGINEYHPARAHMVYLPATAANPDAFVSSRTGRFGGGSRQMTRGDDALLPEIESGKGHVFLAHPLPMGHCFGRAPDMSGGPGPDVVPYTPTMLDQAFRSPAVLGLQLWNEDHRMMNRKGDGQTREVGFHSDDDDGGYGFRNNSPSGFETRTFELQPWAEPARPSYLINCQGVEWMLHAGTVTWDRWLLKGLAPSETADIPWLPAGEPRRWFMAGGSDAHGDLNYHRAGYFQGLERVDDMAIGKPRNLVMAGAPRTNLTEPELTTFESARDRSERRRQPPASPPRRPRDTSVLDDPIRAYDQTQIVAALREGVFSVTDGPALRIAIDRNNNGRIDDADTPMGGIIETYGDTSLPLLVEWQSNQEWGTVYQIDIIVGAVLGTAPGQSRLFAPKDNGPRTRFTTVGDVIVDTELVGDGRQIVQRSDGYYDDPTGGRMRFAPVSFSGTRRIDLPIDSFRLTQAYVNHRLVPLIPDRLFVRAFAKSQPMVGDSATCAIDTKIGRCIPRYAFSNPVWAIAGAREAGTCPRDRPRAIDSDGDGLPDGCDPCPSTSRTRCETGPTRDPEVSRDPDRDG